jgi:hypothetical protein
MWVLGHHKEAVNHGFHQWVQRHQMPQLVTVMAASGP